MYTDLKTTEKDQIVQAFVGQLESGGEYANMTLTRSGDTMRLVIVTDVEPEPSAT